MKAFERSDIEIAGVAGIILLAALFFAYRWHFEQRAQADAALATLSDMIHIDAQTPTAPAATLGSTDTTSIPDLLSAVQRVSSDNDVTVNSVATNATDPKRLIIGVRGEYRNVMLVLGRVETFHATINAFDFTEEDGATNGTIDISYSDKPGAPANFADYIEAIVKFSAVRNPFQPGTPVPLPNASPVLGDLSWTYHLTSISQIGAERSATIDGHDYRPGDKLNGLEIMAIDPAGVRLNAPNTALVQHLHFRRNPGTANG